MTPNDIVKACKELAAKIGPKAWVDTNAGAQGFRGSIYTRGITPDRDDVLAFSIHVSDAKITTFEAMLEALEEQWLRESVKRSARIVEQMALEIIRLTAEFGECTDRALRAKYGVVDKATTEAAIARANEMAANGPFSVVTTALANAA